MLLRWPTCRIAAGLQFSIVGSMQRRLITDVGSLSIFGRIWK
jgi:hypothetical protein